MINRAETITLTCMIYESVMLVMSRHRMKVGVIPINYTCVADVFSIGRKNLRKKGRIDNRLTERLTEIFCHLRFLIFRNNKDLKEFKSKHRCIGLTANFLFKFWNCLDNEIMARLSI